MSGGAGFPEATDRLGPGPPLIAGRIHGARVWAVDSEPDGNFRLVGHAGSEWVPGGRATEAECVGAASRCRHSPSPDCRCGLYGRHPCADDAEDAVNAYVIPDPLSVGGLIEAWGRVELHRDGFRAEYARPVALFVPREWTGTDYETLVERIADRYRARVLHMTEPAELVAYCRANDLGLGEATVRSILGRRTERAERAERAPAPPPPPPLTRAERAYGLVANIVGWAFGIALVLFAAWIGIGLLVWILSGAEDGDTRTRPASKLELHGERSLEVAAEELVPAARGRWLYIATVRNDGDRAAIGVVPHGRALDRDREPAARIGPPRTVEGSANLAPGETGLVWDELRPRPDERRRRADVQRFDVEAGARKLVGRPSSSPVGIAAVRSDRELCIVTATIDSRRPMRRARVALIGRAPDGGASGVGAFRVGPLSRGRREYIVARIPPRACRDPAVDADVYPSLTRRQLLGPTADR